MPILAAASTASTLADLALAVATCFAIVALAAGAFRPSHVRGPDRAEPFGSPWVLLLITLMAFFSCAVVQWAFASHVQSRLSQSGRPQTLPADLAAQLTQGEWAFASTAPALVGFLTMLIGDRLVAGSAGLSSLGLGPNRLAAGVRTGLFGTLIVLPLVAWVLIGTEAVYRWVHYAHPPEHDLLRIMGSSTSRAVKAALIAGAVIVAPLFEEVLFRGHLQTFIRSILLKMDRRRREMLTLISTAGEPELETAPRARPPAAWPAWAAIVLASMFFTVAHPTWTWPPIFFLSICLGYAYERTGSLWTSILIHGLFNGASTWMYLHSLASH